MLFILTQLHVTPVLGFASVTVHSNIAVSPSLTLYGRDRLELTSGLSSNKIYFYQKCLNGVCLYSIQISNLYWNKMEITLTI